VKAALLLHPLLSLLREKHTRMRTWELASCTRGAGACPCGAACCRRQQQGAWHLPHPQAAVAVNGDQARRARRRAACASTMCAGLRAAAGVRPGRLGREREARDGAGVPHARRPHVPCCMPSALSTQLTSAITVHNARGATHVRVCFLRRAFPASMLACSGPRTPLRKWVAASLQPGLPYSIRATAYTALNGSSAWAAHLAC